MMKGGRAAQGSRKLNKDLNQHRGSTSKSNSLATGPAERRRTTVVLSKKVTMRKMISSEKTIGVLCLKTTGKGKTEDEQVRKTKTLGIRSLNHNNQESAFLQIKQWQQQQPQSKTDFTDNQALSQSKDLQKEMPFYVKSHTVQKQRKYRLAPKSSQNFGAVSQLKKSSNTSEPMKLHQSHSAINAQFQDSAERDNELMASGVRRPTHQASSKYQKVASKGCVMSISQNKVQHLQKLQHHQPMLLISSNQFLQDVKQPQILMHSKHQETPQLITKQEVVFQMQSQQDLHAGIQLQMIEQLKQSAAVYRERIDIGQPHQSQKLSQAKFNSLEQYSNSGLKPQNLISSNRQSPKVQQNDLSPSLIGQDAGVAKSNEKCLIQQKMSHNLLPSLPQQLAPFCAKLDKKQSNLAASLHTLADNEMKRCNSLNMQQNVDMSKICDSRAGSNERDTRQGVDGCKTSQNVERKSYSTMLYQPQIEPQSVEVQPTSQEVIFQNFVELYPEQILATQLKQVQQQSSKKSHRTASDELNYGSKSALSSSPKCRLSPDLHHHASALSIMDQQRTPLHDKQRHDSTGRNSYSNLHAYDSMKICTDKSSQLQMQVNGQSQDQSPKEVPFQQVYTANQPFKGHPVGNRRSTEASRLIRYTQRLSISTKQQQNTRTNNFRTDILNEEVFVAQQIINRQLKDAPLVSQVPMEKAATNALGQNCNKAPQQTVNCVLSLCTVNAAHSKSHAQTIVREQTPSSSESHPQYHMLSPQKTLDRGCASNRMARNQGLTEHKRQSVGQLLNPTPDSIKPKQNSLYLHSRDSADSLARDDSQSHYMHEDLGRPIVQQRANNLFGTSPAASLGQTRPKTAAYTRESNRQKGASSQQLNEQLAYAHQQAYGLAPASTIFQKYSRPINGNQSAVNENMYLRGDGIKFSPKESNKLSQKNVHEQVSISSSAKHQIQQNTQTTSQFLSPIAGSNTTKLEVEKKDKQFKIKKVKSKRIQGSASAAAIGFFRQKSVGTNYRKMSAVQKKASKKKDAIAVELDQTSDGGKDKASMSYLEGFIRQQKQLEDEKLEQEEAAAATQAAQQIRLKVTPEPVAPQSKSYNAYRPLSSKKHVSEKICVVTTSQQSRLQQHKNVLLFSQNFVQHEQLAGGDPSTAQNKMQAQQPSRISAQHQQTSHKQPAEPTDTLQQPQQQPTQINHRNNNVASTYQVASQNIIITNPDDFQTTKLLLEICRCVQTRIEDIHLLKQSLDAKMRRTRHINVDLFEDIKNRETIRVTKENALCGRLSGLKQTDSQMTRRQLIKHTKKIHKVFWNVIDSEEESQTLQTMHENRALFMGTELNLLQVNMARGEKIQVFKRTHTIMSKLQEAALRDKDFDLNFCVALGVQKARHSFFYEVMRASRIHIGLMDSNTAQIASIRRALKAMSDSLGQRRLKIVTANAKMQKMFDMLKQTNSEVREHRSRYQQKYEKRKEIFTQLPKSPKRMDNQNPQMTQLSQSRNSKIELRPPNGIKSQAQSLFIVQRQRASNHLTVPKDNQSQLEPAINYGIENKHVSGAALQETQKSHVNKEPHLGRRVSSNIKELLGEHGLIETARTILRGLCMRKYKWHHLYRQQTDLGFKRSFRLRTKDHLRVCKYQFYSRLPILLRNDIESYAHNRAYNHCSMKKGKEHHLTLIVESRVLKLQRFVRSLFKVRDRAALKIQVRLKYLYNERLARLDNLVKSPSKVTNKHIACQQDSFECLAKASYQSPQHHIASPRSPDFNYLPSQARFKEMLQHAAINLQLIPSSRQTLTEKRYVEKHGNQLDIAKNVSTKTKLSQGKSIRTMSISAVPINLRTIQYGRDSASQQSQQGEFELNEFCDQHGDLQNLRHGLWEHYGRQQLSKVIRIQRAIRKFINLENAQSRRIDFFDNTKFSQLYSVDARDAFQARLVSRLERSHIPSAAIDSRQLQLTHGIALHAHQMLSFVALQVKNEESGHSDSDELKSMELTKIYEDLQYHFVQRQTQVKRESTAMRRALFLSQLLKS